MSTKLGQIAKKAKLDRKARFTSLAHLLTPEFLKETWGKMNRKAAASVRIEPGPIVAAQSRRQHPLFYSCGSQLRTVLDLSVKAECLGMDGAYFRVHHFAQQLASPFPLLATVAARTRRIEIGTAVIDMLTTWRRTPELRISLRRATAVGNQPRFSGAGDRWLALFWLPTSRG